MPVLPQFFLTLYYKMSTKYMLMAELKELNRGFPRLPISTMKKHELEANIDILKKYKTDIAVTLPTKTPAKPGPLGPRKIQFEEKEQEDEGEENVIIKAPVAPKPRPVAPPKKVVVQAPGESSNAAPPKKSPGRPPKAKPESVGPKDDGKSKSDRVTKCFCNCNYCDRK